jgi:alpha-N-arabinofuranosidase
MARHSDIFFMANYAQTVNVIGCIKTTKTDAALATTGLVLKLYRKHFGQIPVVTESSPLLDAQAAFSTDGKQLTLAVVNPSTEPREVPVTLQGVRLAGTGTRWQIAGDDPMVYNEPGVSPRVQIEESLVEEWSDTLSLPACSVTLWQLDVE